MFLVIQSAGSRANEIFAKKIHRNRGNYDFHSLYCANTLEKLLFLLWKRIYESVFLGNLKWTVKFLAIIVEQQRERHREFFSTQIIVVALETKTLCHQSLHKHLKWRLYVLRIWYVFVYWTNCNKLMTIKITNYCTWTRYWLQTNKSWICFLNKKLK